MYWLNHNGNPVGNRHARDEYESDQRDAEVGRQWQKDQDAQDARDSERLDEEADLGGEAGGA